MKGTTSKEKDEVKAQLTALTAKIGEAMKKAREGVAKQTVAPVVGAASTAATSWKKLSADSEKQRLDRELELLAKSKAATETSTNGVSAKSTTSEAGASLVKSPELSAAASPLPAPTKEADQSRMEALQKTLASLQEEAKQLGIPASQIAAQGTGFTPSTHSVNHRAPTLIMGLPPPKQSPVCPRCRDPEAAESECAPELRPGGAAAEAEAVEVHTRPRPISSSPQVESYVY
jgi:hypothetical protein